MNITDQPPLRSSDSLYDVIVVGARAAGAATAMLLARAGVRTLLLDHGSLGADTLSTHALMRGGVLQLSRWGLLGDIVAAGTPAVRRTRFDYADARIDIDIKSAHGVDALYAPRRTILDPLLVRAAAEAGAVVHHRTSVHDLLTSYGRVTGVRAIAADGASVDIGAPLVVGADGIRSTVARRTGAPYTRVGAHTAANTYGYWTDLSVDGYEWVFRRGGSCGVIPTNDGKACVFAGGPASRIGRGGVALITDVVAEAAPELSDRLRSATAPQGTRTWNGHHGFMRRAHGPGWALVGDAGYFKDPISAHGITDALRDAELLARAIIDGAAGERSRRTALEWYEETRDALSIPLFDVVDRIAGHEWDDAEIAALLLQLSTAMADEVDFLAGLDRQAAA